jgi:hypothetical protein
MRWSPYLVGGTERLEVELGQSLNDIAATLDEIFPYERSKSEELFVRVAVLVNDLHLLDYCRLSGLAGACCRESVSACMKKAMLGAKQDQVGRDGLYLRMCVHVERGWRVRCWVRVVRSMGMWSPVTCESE